MSEVYPLQDRIALVTGASSGLGRHFGLLLAANGAHVALAARSIDRVADTAKAITDQGGKALAVALDVTDRASVDAAVARIEDELGPIQILVNNAGVAATAPFLDMTEQDWAQVLDTNLTGVWRVGQAVARRMAPLGRGSIINISSIIGHGVQRQQANYSVAKAGVAQLTRIMALELGELGIRVNALAPGYVATEINHDFFASEKGKAYITRLFPRRLGEASELDGALMLLASDAGSYIQGTTITVDGGSLLKGL
ncbi:MULTISPECIES: SDR family NAD(P)-dependent oxidoreductase [Sphingobium]|nr:SDR family oxidoreductase [Sphingobium indicum]